MTGRRLRKWVGLGPIVLLVAIACESVGPAEHTLALCESALARRLAVENDQARFLGESTLAFSAFETAAHSGGVEWRRLEAQHAEAQSDINTYCLELVDLATPTPSPIPTATPPEPTPTGDPDAPRVRRRSLIPGLEPTPTEGE